ncbi:hypothetical protein BS643_17925 [Pseudomonas protegens]|uniref:hypothetical protein n=1 Tax=Pseudomonas TaxID=286 RepID=UPI0008070605|nr:hypothetical protein [Pseudomonas protegens]RBJ81302.1 hypothetical protein C3L29_016655 [Pseudomonas sp. MWU12-2534b]OBZ19671.1 hypothetical protein BBH57_22795 [Pseudomonas protegens]OBZ19704.1 hypothetical protein BBH57_22985 [Pseudomonas protegens]OBZ22470.1 hypothetical protein BBH58_17050 [Pseudomonas protegens]OKK41287.1 hypothetical protein BS643_17925 [Pseudomonas protegens]
MGNALNVTTQLPPAEAEALLAMMRESYRLSLNDYWYADEFRTVPNDLRHSSILKKKPAMAAQKRLMAALSLSLKAAK